MESSPAPARDRVQVDDRLAGINFIEVLFALVVARTLEPIAHYQRIPAVGWSHLVTAGVLTIASWIGYHNSQNRPRFFIRFRSPLTPLAQFVIDVALVVIYWLTAISAEGTGSRLGDDPSARPETLLVLLAFILYCFWDEVGVRIRRDNRFSRRLIENDVPRRRDVTRVATSISLVIALGAWIWDPHDSSVIVAIDGVLVALLIGFRVAKDLWPARPMSRPDTGGSSTGQLLDVAQRALEELRRSLPRSVDDKKK